MNRIQLTNTTGSNMWSEIILKGLIAPGYEEKPKGKRFARRDETPDGFGGWKSCPIAFIGKTIDGSLPVRKPIIN